jgi:hypothetical protein
MNLLNKGGHLANKFRSPSSTASFFPESSFIAWVLAYSEQRLTDF